MNLYELGICHNLIKTKSLKVPQPSSEVIHLNVDFYFYFQTTSKILLKKIISEIYVLITKHLKTSIYIFHSPYLMEFFKWPHKISILYKVRKKLFHTNLPCKVS